MVTFLKRIRWKQRSEQGSDKEQAKQNSALKLAQKGALQVVDIAPNDPIVAYCLSLPGAIEIERLQLDSPTLKELKAAGVKLTIPLVTQGELVGLINLGSRLSELGYSSYDTGLLNSLAAHAAPALRVAQMALEQQAQARERERIEQELHIARVIQQTLLPKELPTLPCWRLTTFYQPARAVGGDFYDFIQYEDGKLGLVVGDVTDKGVPAALVMATTRSILRSAAQVELTPGKVLERANDLLFPDIPPRMFVTCFYAILDPQSGKLRYANAGHDLPYRWCEGEVTELRATGMPLGLMPGMEYEEKEMTLAQGESVLLYSDGLVEAHNPDHALFGFPRLITLLSAYQGETSPIDYLRMELKMFTGEGWEQEDDITLVTLHRAIVQSSGESEGSVAKEENQALVDELGAWRVLDTQLIPSEMGNEGLAISYVTEAVKPFDLPERRIERLKTAVAEATINAIEHGNHYDPELPVKIQVLSSESAIAVRISDRGHNDKLTRQEYELPDIEAKLAELQSPRGWGLFLIQNMVDEVRVLDNEQDQTVELIMRLDGGSHDNKNA